MASALVRRSRGLAGDTVLLCSWARHFTLTVPLSTQKHKWVPVNCWGNLKNCGGVSCDGLPSHSGELAEIVLAASCYRNRYKLRRLWVSRLQGFTILRMLNQISCYSSPGSAVPSKRVGWSSSSSRLSSSVPSASLLSESSSLDPLAKFFRRCSSFLLRIYVSPF